MLKVFGVDRRLAARRVLLLLRRPLLAPRRARLVLIAALAIFAFGHGPPVAAERCGAIIVRTRRPCAPAAGRAVPERNPEPAYIGAQENRTMLIAVPPIAPGLALRSSLRSPRSSTAGCDIVTADLKHAGHGRLAEDVHPRARRPGRNRERQRPHPRRRRRTAARSRSSREKKAQGASQRTPPRKRSTGSRSRKTSPARRFASRPRRRASSGMLRRLDRGGLHGAGAGRRRSQVRHRQRRHRDVAA